ncbi:MAG: radical SAM protein [Clostridiales bacterium]|nr:radical SAM protein [Clostridiales bacterium]
MSKKLANNYVYLLDGHAYVNLTNKCHNACNFCIRNTGDGVAGTPLWLIKEPTADEVLVAFGKVKNMLTSDEVVFCGYGEPTERLDTLLECAARLKALGYKLRLNTNGLGDLVNKKSIAPLLANFDTVSVSLNESTPEKYLSVTKSVFGTDALPAVIAFAESCKREGIYTVFTVVDTIGGADIEECKRISERTKVPLRVREYISDNYGEER